MPAVGGWRLGRAAGRGHPPPPKRSAGAASPENTLSELPAGLAFLKLEDRAIVSRMGGNPIAFVICWAQHQCSLPAQPTAQRHGSHNAPQTARAPGASFKSEASGAPNSSGKSISLAHTTQWMGLSGELRRVQTGKVLGVGLGWHSKHSVRPLRCTLTCMSTGFGRNRHAHPHSLRAATYAAPRPSFCCSSPTPPSPPTHLPKISRGARLHQRYARRHTQAIDVAPRLEVVQPIQHAVKPAEEVHPKPRLLDVGLRQRHAHSSEKQPRRP